MADITALRAWKEGGHGWRHLQVEFYDECVSHELTIFPNDGHIELAEKMHILADEIARNPALNRNDHSSKTAEERAIRTEVKRKARR